jgi:hypothetical protein
MIEPLNEAQQHWVETTFETLSTEDKVAQLLIPNLGSYDDDMSGVTPFLQAGTLGGIFVGAPELHQCALVLSGQPASCRESLVWRSGSDGYEPGQPFAEVTHWPVPGADLGRPSRAAPQSFLGC